MGTRSLTRVFDIGGGQEYELLSMYRQYDGYPKGHGQELAGFLLDIKLVNGMSHGDPPKIANGMGCLAAQIVAFFKEGPGGVYLQPHGNIDASQEFEYLIRPKGRTMSIEVHDIAFEWDKPRDEEGRLPKRRTVLFEGTPAEMIAWIQTPEKVYDLH